MKKPAKTCVYIYSFTVPSITGDRHFFRGQLKIVGALEDTEFHKSLNTAAMNDWRRHRKEVITEDVILFDFISLVFIADTK